MKKALLFYVSLILILLFGRITNDTNAAEKKQPVYINFFIHCEASPIRGIPVDVQYEPYDGTGILPRNQYLDDILDVCEKYNIKFKIFYISFLEMSVRIYAFNALYFDKMLIDMYCKTIFNFLLNIFLKLLFEPKA